MSRPTTGVKLDDEIQERLKLLSDVKSRSVHWMMKEAIRRYIETEERYEREKAEDQARYQAYVETGQCIEHQAMMEWLDGLAGQTSER